MAMNWLVQHVVSGDAYFTGLTLLAAGVVGSTGRPIGLVRWSPLVVTLGLIAVFASSTPWSDVVVALIMATIISNIVISRRWPDSKWNSIWPGLIVCVAAGGWELGYRVSPRLENLADRRLIVIGDSLTAGLGPDSPVRTWPQLLVATHGIEVADNSHVGETAASALRRIRQRPLDGSLILIEIGGNDVLGFTTPAQFREDLEALLDHLSQTRAQLVMLELPVPPLCAAYGQAQRVLAGRYRVRLIPKRVLLSVIADEDATLDGLHLSQSGQQRMADAMWRFIGPALPPETAISPRTEPASAPDAKPAAQE
jgi:acyl-CoA thioesterase I